jgi:hypothetical protein
MMRRANMNRLAITVFTLPLLLLCLGVMAGAAGEECRTKSYQGKFSCYKQTLERIVQTHGTEQALDTLHQLASVDPDVRQQSHPYAHHIGRFSYSHYRDVTIAFAHCKDTFASGCYHGVLEGYLSAFTKLEPLHISSICSGKMDPQRAVFLKFLCVHGLGHGLTMYFQHDIFKALTFCDALPVARDQEICYAGVFMENIVAFTTRREHGMHSTHTTYLDPRNPLYPCTVVERRYQQACYLMQSSAILALNNFDFTQAFPECDKAPVDLIATCYQSMGRDVSGFSLTHPEKTRTLCLLARQDYIGQCFSGAAKDAIYVHADPQRGIALCRVADEPYKADCYTGVREFLVDFLADQTKLDQACRTADEAYQSICAGHPPRPPINTQSDTTATNERLRGSSPESLR